MSGNANTFFKVLSDNSLIGNYLQGKYTEKFAEHQYYIDELLIMWTYLYQYSRY